MIPALPVIFAWPLAALYFFGSMALPRALCWCIIGGYLFLPTQVSFDLPVVPTIDKYSMPSLAALLIILVMGGAGIAKTERTGRLGWFPRHVLLLTLMVGLIASAFLTVISNPDTIVQGPVVLPGLKLYDSLSAVLGTTVELLPFLLARRYLATPDHHRQLLQILCIVGLIYSAPILFEVVMSPQINLIVYGFFPHDWAQHIRGGHYRPVVFLHHGLWLAIFMCCTVIAAFALFRIHAVKQHKFYFFVGIWLFIILVLCRSLGALGIALMMIPSVLFLGLRMQMLCAALIAAIILIYPMLRGVGLVPVEQVISLAQSISDERTASLQTRLINEDILLAKANLKPFFGWGGWGRSLIYNEYGQNTSVTDGIWAIIIGRDGWFGYLSRFGLLCLPIIWLTLRRKSYTAARETAALCIVLAANLIDLIPNAGLTPVTWLIAGALAGRLELSGAQIAPDSETSATGSKGRVPRYTRFKPELSDLPRARPASLSAPRPPVSYQGKGGNVR